jgi:hypothetical protein
MTLTLPNSKSPALPRPERQILYLEFQIPFTGRENPRFGVGVEPNSFRSVKNDWGELHRPYTNVSLKFASQKKGAWPSWPCEEWSACSRASVLMRHTGGTTLSKKSKRKLLLV